MIIQFDPSSSVFGTNLDELNIESIYFFYSNPVFSVIFFSN
jgi:hypothetical protein